jgi:hypothetical protein
MLEAELIEAEASGDALRQRVLRKQLKLLARGGRHA